MLLTTYLNRLLTGRRRHEILILLPILIVVGGTLFFIKVAGEMREGETQRFDEWMIRSFRRSDNPAIPVGPGWLQEAGRDLTALGGTAVLVLMIGIVAGYLAIQRKYRALRFVVAAALSGLLLSTLLKQGFHRARPNIVPQLSIVSSPSFPSGHSMLSAVVYLTLGALLARTVADIKIKLYLLTVALLLAFLVGISRVYLGVHYPTDVLAGWTAGLVWAVICLLIAQTLQRRGMIEPPAKSSEDLLK